MHEQIEALLYGKMLKRQSSNDVPSKRAQWTWHTKIPFFRPCIHQPSLAGRLRRSLNQADTSEENPTWTSSFLFLFSHVFILIMHMASHLTRITKYEQKKSTQRVSVHESCPSRATCHCMRPFRNQTPSTTDFCMNLVPFTSYYPNLSLQSNGRTPIHRCVPALLV